MEHFNEIESIQPYFTDSTNFKQITLGCLELLVNRDKYKKNSIHEVAYIENVTNLYQTLTSEFPKFDSTTPRPIDTVVVWVYGATKERQLHFAKQLDSEENSIVITGNSLRTYEQERTCIIQGYIRSKYLFDPIYFLDPNVGKRIGTKKFNSRIIYMLSHKHPSFYVDRTVYKLIDKCVEISSFGAKEVVLPFRDMRETDKYIKSIFEAYIPLFNSVYDKSIYQKRRIVESFHVVELTDKYRTFREDIIHLSTRSDTLYYEENDTHIKTYLNDLIRVSNGKRGVDISKHEQIYEIINRELVPIKYKTLSGTIIDLSKYCCCVDNYVGGLPNRIYTLSRLRKLINA
jgi:hypothetical protein